MSTILAYTSPAIGHLFPLTAILLELRNRGHTVHVRAPGDSTAMLQTLGLHAEPVHTGIEEIQHNDYTAVNPRQALRYVAELLAERGKLDGPDLQQAIDVVQPDALIVDINSWGAMFAAEASSIPWATFSPFIPPLSSPRTPPFGPGLRPMKGPVGRARDAVMRRLVIGAVEKAMIPSINTLRSDWGLHPVESVDEFYRRASLMLVATAKPFEYETTDWGEDVVMIGACDWDPPQATPDWIEGIERPVVLVTTSSEFQDDGLLVKTALDALAGEPLHVVATMPAAMLASDARSTPDATIVPFVPHSAVLEKAVLAITHGGMGATQKALARGVPVCVVPFGRDQLEVARRVEVSKSGTWLPAKNLNPERLRTSAKTAMTMSAGARHVAAGFAAAGGPVAAATAIEERLLSAGERPAENVSKTLIDPSPESTIAQRS